MFDANKISGSSYVRNQASRRAPKLLQHHPGTRYIPKQKLQTLSMTIHKNIFSLKSQKNKNIQSQQ